MLSSCGGEEKAPIQLQEILPEGAGEGVRQVEEEVEDSLEYIDSNALGVHQELLSALYGDSSEKFIAVDQRFYLDRFQHSEVNKYWYDSTFHVYIYKYADTLDCAQSFYHYLDCIGRKCESLNLLEEKKLKQVEPQAILVKESYIYCIRDNNFPIKRFKKLFTMEEQDFDYLLVVDSKGRSRWLKPESSPE